MHKQYVQLGPVELAQHKETHKLSVGRVAA